MDLSFIAAIGPIAAGIGGLAAFVKIFVIDRRAQKSTETQNVAQAKISADDLALRADSEIVDNAIKLAQETREQFEDYREYTNRRFDEMADQIDRLRAESSHKDEKILLLTVDRDTLIQHALSAGATPIPELRTVAL